MNLDSWTKKYFIPLDEATVSDTAALFAYLRQLDGILSLDSEERKADLAIATLDVYFRFGREPRLVDPDLNTFHFNQSTCPLCIRHPRCATTRSCPLIRCNRLGLCCFEPGDDEDPESPSPWLSLVKGDPIPMMIRVRKAIKWLRKHGEKDGCTVCNGEKGGVPGNENVIDGKLVCDYCLAVMLEEKKK
jgi:hypothetical protein